MQVSVSVLPVFYSSTRLFLSHSHNVRYNGMFDLTVFFPKFWVPLNRADTVAKEAQLMHSTNAEWLKSQRWRENSKASAFHCIQNQNVFYWDEVSWPFYTISWNEI